METLVIEITDPKARKLIDGLIDIGMITLKSSLPSRTELWRRLDSQLPQTEPDITEEEIMEEIKAYRLESEPVLSTPKHRNP